ncbi:MAG: cysteine--tRNA ligase [Caldiserica bacterium]|jgi:cysteinyl-tRNA synthetase|nr:cysteine--tRNA ligase [Caldisericota bacterium]MDH7563034.1 cysteine--tRNA ligase [Caldisericota bacterium]
MVKVQFFNTYSRRKETFTPLRQGEVRMYTCGPTVYDFVHIGNFRTFIFEDLLRRSLKFLGFKVIQVMNLTDVEDKIIKASREKGVTIFEYTEPFIQAFFEDASNLNIEPAEYYPRATEHIPQMIELIEELFQKGFAYSQGDSIYFDISKFPKYGRLSRIKPGSRAFSRLDADEYEKQEVGDFVLWKGKKEGEPFWESPFGPGRPGWHIECSAMSMHYLGPTFDIHTGGIDNMFPHHENEIAQSEAATGQTFVRFWMHSQHLLVNGERMAKSKGNFYTLRDLQRMNYSFKAIRFLLLSTHYRNPLNFTFEALKQAEKSVERLLDFYHRLKEYQGKEKEEAEEVLRSIREIREEFVEALADDLNISGAISAVFSLMHEINPMMVEGTLKREGAILALKTIEEFDQVLGILEKKGELEDWVQNLIKQREEARKRKDFATADRIRAELLERGIVLEDTAQGTRWRKKTLGD